MQSVPVPVLVPSFAQPTFPGTSFAQAAEVIAGETGELRTVPLLPSRGLRADHVAFTCAMLPELPIEKGPRSWRVSQRPQILTRRAWDTFEQDKDELEAAWGNNVPLLTHALGPLSLAVELELSNGHRMITDRGAVRDLVEMLAEAIAREISTLRSRFQQPAAVHLYEPHLDALAQGSIPGTHDFDEIRAIHRKDITEILQRFVGIIRSKMQPEEQSMKHLRHIGLASEPSETALEVMGAIGVDVVLLDLQKVRGTQALDSCGALLASRITPAFILGERNISARQAAIQIARRYDELGLDRSLLTAATATVPGTATGSLLEHAHGLGHARECAAILVRDAGDL